MISKRIRGICRAALALGDGGETRGGSSPPFGASRNPQALREPGRLFDCAPGRAHSLGGGSPLRTLMTGTVSRIARAAAGRGGQKSAEGIGAAAHGGEGKEHGRPEGGLVPRRTKETQAGWLRGQRTPGG